MTNQRGPGNRNAAWKTLIDQRVASGLTIGGQFVSNLSNQYGVPLSQIGNFTSKNNYTLGPKAQAAVSGSSVNANNNSNRLKLLTDALNDFKFPEPKDPMFTPGGVSAGVDTNATGFRRKKSSARTAGLTSKGTSQFKISGQSARSSGLNIGV